MSSIRIYKNFWSLNKPEMESQSFGPSNKSKIKQKTPAANLQCWFEGACV